jgi:hypothetical protein
MSNANTQAAVQIVETVKVKVTPMDEVIGSYFKKDYWVNPRPNPEKQFKLTNFQIANEFKQVELQKFAKGEVNLVAGMVIIFNDGKMAEVEVIKPKTSIIHKNAFKYISPYTGAECLISVIAGTVSDVVRGEIKNVAHFLKPRKEIKKTKV